MYLLHIHCIYDSIAIATGRYITNTIYTYNKHAGKNKSLDARQYFSKRVTIYCDYYFRDNHTNMTKIKNKLTNEQLKEIQGLYAALKYVQKYTMDNEDIVRQLKDVIDVRDNPKNINYNIFWTV